MSKKESTIEPGVDTTDSSAIPVGEPNGEEAASSRLEELRGTYERARDELRETTSRLRGELQSLDAAQVSERTRDWVKRNPSIALLIAAGGGALLGWAAGKVMRDHEEAQRRSRGWRGLANRSFDQFRGHARSLAGRADSWGDNLSSRAAELRDTTSETAEEIVSRLADVAGKASETLEDVRLSSKQRREIKSHIGRAVSGAVKAAGGAVLLGTLKDWLKRRS